MEGVQATTIQITDLQDIQRVTHHQYIHPAGLMTVYMQIGIIQEGGHRAVFRSILPEPNRFKGVILKQEQEMQGGPMQ